MNEQVIAQQPTPAHIMQVGMGFWASKTLLTAIKLKLFTLLAGTKLSAAAIKEEYDFQTTSRHVYDWLDALVALGFLQREGLLDDALYFNTIETDIFLDTKKPSYMGGILEMGNNRLYGFWYTIVVRIIHIIAKIVQSAATRTHQIGWASFMWPRLTRRILNFIVVNTSRVTAPNM